MRRPFPVILLSWLALAAAAAVGAAPLRIGVESMDQPVSFLDETQRPAGFTPDLVRAMGRAGLGEVEFVARPWSLLLKDFNAGEIDVLANVGRTEDRLGSMDFSIAHASVRAVIYQPQTAAPMLTTASFSGKTLAVLNASLAHKHAAVHGGWSATIRPFDSAREAVAALRAGECDALILGHGGETKHTFDPAGLRRDFVADVEHVFRFAVRRGDTATLARLNDALAAVRADGTFDRLYSRWIGPINPRPLRWAELRPYAGPVGLGLLVLALVIAWQSHLLRRVSRQTRALKENEALFHRLVDAAFEGWTIHQGGVMKLANSTYAATYGYTVAELIGRPILDLSPPESHPRISAAIAEGRTTPYETTGRRKDGTLIPLEIVGQACTFEGRPARIAAVRDLTAAKRAAADQLVLSKLESTGLLAGGIAHDFNNLLAIQVLNLDLALAGQRLTPEVTELIQGAKNAAFAARNLTQQLITFAKGSAPVRAPTALQGLLARAVPLALGGANVRAEIVADEGLWPAAVDAGQIERVVANLVTNAREAMPAGGLVTLRLGNFTADEGFVPGLAPGRYVHLRVADRGYGIPPAAIAKIFDPYFSAKERGVQKGMGLGLTICHSIVQQHRGAITVESRPGDGATFHVYLPASQEPVAVATAAPPPAPVSPGRILVMDDEEIIRETVSRALKLAGYSVTTAGDGEEAVRLFSAARTGGEPFAAVLLDLTVHAGLGGVGALRALRALDPDIKAAVMSGHAADSALGDYLAHGFQAALAKPFDLAQLRSTIARLLPA